MENRTVELQALEEKERRRYGCDCCQGDKALYWVDNENNAFVGKGDMLVTVKDKTIRFKVKCCPNCGRKFL